MSNPTTWRLLIVDDNEKTCSEVQEYLEGESLADPQEHMKVEVLSDFSNALEALEASRFDVLILDVRLQARGKTPDREAGIVALEAIKKRRFIPVVFYTGLPHLVRDLETPLIRVVEKTTDLPHLLEVVQSIFATHIPLVSRALLHHLEAVQRDYMWDFVAQNWKQFGFTPDRTALAHLLARRLAISLSGPGIKQLARDLGDSISGTSEGKVHPMQYYLMPPIESAPLSGDIYKGQIGDQNGYWALLTPSCDLVAGREKAEWVLFARCVLLSEQAEYQKWHEGLPQLPDPIQEKLEALLRNNRQAKGIQPDRFHFLPGALALPDLVVDFQQLTILPRSEIGNLKRLASLDSPFAEALLSRFIRYFGRLGTPDLDVDLTVARLRDGLSLRA
jgi:CheY-like chemotaxis protein